MRKIMVTLSAVLVLSALSTAQNPTSAPLPNTIFVGADGKFELRQIPALIQFNISAQATAPKMPTTRPPNKPRPRARFCAATASIPSRRKSASSR